MRNNILTLLVGFVVLVCTVMLVKLGLDRMTDAEAATSEQYAQVSVDLQRREIVYRVQPGDTLWGLADRFYGNGRRWTEIARANNLRENDPLASGATIKIPLAANAQPIAVPIPPVEPAPPSEAAPAALPEEKALGVALCQVDRAAYPKGVTCAARMSEDLCVTINAYADDASAQPLASYAAPRGDVLLGLYARDIDADGSQELFTIWQQRGFSTSRVFRLEDGKLVLVSETPDDPVAIKMLRDK